MSSTEQAQSGKSSAKGLLGAAMPLVAKVKGVNPAAAKESATRGAAGSKDIVKMSVAYLKQETKGPLAGIKRYAIHGLAASVLFATGSILLMLGALRGYQSAWAKEGKHRGIFAGGWSFVPYALTALTCIAALGLIYVVYSRASRRRNRS